MPTMPFQPTGGFVGPKCSHGTFTDVIATNIWPTGGYITPYAATITVFPALTQYAESTLSLWLF